MSFVMSAGLVQIETSLGQAKNRLGDHFTLVQECFRHFDLEKVGTDSVHLSLFEMPGAFVFGQNGKAETVRRMWTLATSVLGIDKGRLWVSYFGGGKVVNDDVPCDEETRRTWLTLGVSENRMVGLGAKDNYWMQGDGIGGVRPPRKGGPNTELFWDMRPGQPCKPGCRPGCKCGRFVEFSNSLFICRELGGQQESWRPMIEPFSETVIGTERVAMILQGKQSVFDTDNFKPIIDMIERFVQSPLIIDESLVASSKRVIADHLRALCFLVSDGAPPPGKDGRERIVKLLIRGVIARQIVLGIHTQEFLPVLIGCITQTLSNTLRVAPNNVERLILYFTAESQRFSKTVERGRRQLERLLEENEPRTLSGPQIVCLEKQCGLPPLLASAMLRERGLVFAEAEYVEALEDWKQIPHS